MLALLALLASGCSYQDTARPSAVLITLDTTRADALSCTGAPVGLTPHVDRLAREGVLYRQARTVAPMTLPAHASMLTGLYPPRSTVRLNAPDPLPEAAETVAERAAAFGLDTAAFVAAAVLDRRFGLAQGFEVWVQPGSDDPDAAGHLVELPAAEVVQRVRAWLARRDPDRPFFLWVHLFDPHLPYEPEPRHRLRALGDPYLAEVAAADEAIGELLAALDEHAGLDRTFVALVADHGEGRGEHGEATHAAHLFDSTVRVPLILRHPDGWRAGEVSDEPVSVVDLHPTLLDALALGPAGEVDGQSLHRARMHPDRGVYFETYYGFVNFGWSPLAGWFQGGRKYLHGSAPVLFDVRADPGELAAIAPLAPELEPFLAGIRAVSDAPALPGDAGASGGEVDGALLERLRDLGYAVEGERRSALPSPLEPSRWPSPNARLAEMQDYELARELSQRGEALRALPILDRILAENPAHANALHLLVLDLIEQGRLAEGLQRLSVLDAGHVDRIVDLADTLRRRGRREEARRVLDRAAELAPGDARVLARQRALDEP